MFPFLVNAPSEYGWRQVHPFPMLSRLQAEYQARRAVDRSFWNGVSDLVGDRLHCSNPVFRKTWYPLGHTFRGKVCIAYPTFDGGRMFGQNIDHPLGLFVMGEATPQVACAIVVSMLTAHKLVTA